VAVDFIDIGGIVDHHCLNFFHKFLYETEWESTIKYNRIGGVMVCVLASGASPDRIKPKTIKLVFVASLLSMQH
jgi:hypothetical protein